MNRGEPTSQKKVLLLLSIIFAQAFLLIFFGCLEYLETSGQLQSRVVTGFSVLSLCCGVLAGVFAALLVRSVVHLARAEVEAELNKVRFEEACEFVDVLRAQRHDFLNQLQVLYGLIQIGRLDVLKGYLEQVQKEHWNLSRYMVYLNSRPEVAGLLLRKMMEADAQGVACDLEVMTSLLFLDMPPLDFTRILGNLIDNALEAVRTVPQEQRRIRIVFGEAGGFYVVKVNNYRPLIPPEEREKIFQKGYTTKARRGEGLGLYIVKSLVEKNRGRVFVESSEAEGTTFTLFLPAVYPTQSRASSAQPA